MFSALGYDGVAAQASTWLTDLSPILVLLGGVALSLVLGGMAIAVVGRGRSGSTSSGHAGLDKRMR